MEITHPEDNGEHFRNAKRRVSECCFLWERDKNTGCFCYAYFPRLSRSLQPPARSVHRPGSLLLPAPRLLLPGLLMSASGTSRASSALGGSARGSSLEPSSEAAMPEHVCGQILVMNSEAVPSQVHSAAGLTRGRRVGLHIVAIKLI